MPRTREDQKSQVQQATDIVDLVGEQLALTRKGKEFLCLCPFHDDHRPSMHVVPEKQIYKCFSCGAGGDVFSFVMNYHKMTFPESLKYLADRAGIALEAVERDPAEGPSDRQRLTDAHQRALAFFQKALDEAETGRVARDYIEQRGISREMLLAFQIGYAPQGWDNLATAMRQRRWDPKGMAAAGLVARSEKTGNLFDRFRHRLIFPICDALGRPIAFGGRKLDEQDEPKYLNSPEHALFNKSATLYGLHLAKKAIIDSGAAVIVEGYTDVIACHQAGVCNVVATLGTALTPQHARQLRRYAKKVVLIFDADEAGQKAADRALEIFLTESLDVAIAVLPDGQDPADLLSKPDGLEQWRTAVDRATDALSYQFARFRGKLNAEDSISGRQSEAEAYIQRLAQVGLGQVNPIRRAMLLRQLADLLGVPERTIELMLRRHRPRRSVETAEADGAEHPLQAEAGGIAPPRLRAIKAAERHLIGGLLTRPALFHQALADGVTLDEAVTPAELVTPTAARLYEVIYDALAAGRELTPAGLLGDLAERGKPDLAELATAGEREVDACCGADTEALTRLVLDAAQVIREHHARQAYEQTRNGAPNDQALHEIAAHLKNRPHPGRMPVVRR